MRLFAYNGQLYSETGERIEGIMACQTEYSRGLGPGPGITTVQFTMLLEDIPFPSDKTQIEAVAGLTNILASLSEEG